MSGSAQFEHFLTTDPSDVGCDEALGLLHVYVDLVLDEGSEEAARRYPGVAAHLLACGPCDDDFNGLLLAVRAPVSTEPDQDGRPEPTSP